MPIPRTSQNLCAKSNPFPITGIFIKHIPFLIYFYTANTYNYSTILYINRQCTYCSSIIYLLFFFLPTFSYFQGGTSNNIKVKNNFQYKKQPSVLENCFCFDFIGSLIILKSALPSVNPLFQLPIWYNSHLCAYENMCRKMMRKRFPLIILFITSVQNREKN